jgi:hypothetical protein
MPHSARRQRDRKRRKSIMCYKIGTYQSMHPVMMHDGTVDSQASLTSLVGQNPLESASRCNEGLVDSHEVYRPIRTVGIIL